MSPRRLRLVSWLCAIAMAPSVFFFGHWTPSVDLPGTNIYLGFPRPSHARADAGDHERHCHSSSASCSDQPGIGFDGFGILAAALAVLAAAGALRRIATSWWVPSRILSIPVELAPPRPGLLTT
jgi:MYXO-CTERM domain-containing protein